MSTSPRPAVAGGASSTLGRRLRGLRAALKLTLKDVQAMSGFSATHISEIERSRTSPTIGALVKIAAALGKPPGFFLDEKPPRGSAWARGTAVAVESRGVTSVPLTPRPTGAVLDAQRLDLPAGRRAVIDETLESWGYVLAGGVRLTAGARSWELGEGDTFHAASSDQLELRAVGAATVLLVAAQSPRP